MITNHKLVFKLFDELTDEQKELVQTNLAYVPFGERESSTELWNMYINGEAIMGYVKDDKGDILAYVFYRIDSLLTGGQDFFILSAVKVEGVNTVNLTEDCIPQLEAKARKEEIESISLKTIHPALALKLVNKLGWHISEITLRKKLN